MLLAVGIFIGREVPLPATHWYAVFAGSFIVSLLIRFCFRVGPKRASGEVVAFDAGINLSVVLLGACLLSSTERADAAGRLRPPYPDFPVRAWGWVVTPLNPTRSGFSFVLGADSVVSPDWVDRQDRELMVYMSDRTTGARPEPGSRIGLVGTLERFPEPRNPGENDYGASLGLQGISGILRAQVLSAESSAGNGSVRSWVGAIQHRLYAWIDKLHPGEHGSFVKGIILGYRADLPEELKEAFMVSGTVHVLAVSGSNVALIGLIVMVCAGFLRLNRTLRVALTIVGMLFYMLVTGGGPSITRATIMGIIIVLLAFLPRRGDVLQSLGISACILLLVDPRNLFDAGFLLSFTSVVWIVTGSPVVERFISRLPEEFRESLVLRSALQLCGISLLAQLGTVPVSALTFGQISLISVLANLVVVPLSAVVLLVGVAELAFYAIWPVLAQPYAEANGLIIDVLLGVVRLAADVPFASVHVRLNGLVESALLYCVFVFLLWFSTGAVRNTALIVGLVCANLIVWPSALAGGERRLVWIAADVGQGDAHVITTPDGYTVVIDVAPQVGTAERVLLPLLDRQGITRIEMVLLSHPHRDHTAGLGVLLDRIPVRTLVVTDSVTFRQHDLERIERAGTRVLRARTGDILPVGPSSRFYVMHPDVVEPWGGWNNNSLVVMAQYGDARVLFTGDLEVEGEAQLVTRYGDFLSSSLLKAGHHGSKTSTSEALLHAVRPSDAIMSVGWRNRFGHPSAHLESLLRERGVTVHKTSDRGASWWETDGREWKRVEWAEVR